MKTDQALIQKTQAQNDALLVKFVKRWFHALEEISPPKRMGYGGPNHTLRPTPAVTVLVLTVFEHT